jgi:hypothetical protein
VGAQLVLTTALLHFPELEVELDLLGYSYNADLSSDEIAILWTQTYRVSKSISSRVHPLTARNPLDRTEEE